MFPLNLYVKIILNYILVFCKGKRKQLALTLTTKFMIIDPTYHWHLLVFRSYINKWVMNFMIFCQRKFNLFYLLALIICWINFKGGPPCVACLIVIKHLTISLLIKLTCCEKPKVESTVTAYITIWYHWFRKLNLIYKFRKKLERKCNFCIKILVFLFSSFFYCNY